MTTTFDHSSGSPNTRVGDLRLDPEPIVHPNGDREFRRPDKRTKRTPEQSRERWGNLGLGLVTFLLLGITVLAGWVSIKAQYDFILGEKGDHTAAWMEAVLIDLMAVSMSTLGLVMALKGKSSLIERILALVAVAASIGMNLLSADLTDFRSVAVWVLAPLVYAVTSDRLIVTVRRFMSVEEDGNPLSSLKGLVLWFLRLCMDPIGTLKGFRSWVLTLPVGPGGHRLPAKADTGIDPDPEPTKVRADRLDTDTDIVVEADTVPAIEADTGHEDTDMSAPDIEPVKVPVATVTDMSARKGRQAEALELMSARPDITAKELAAELGVTDRQARRYMSARKSA